MKSAIRNVACNLAKPVSNLLGIVDWRFRINRLTRLVPMPVRFVLRNDDIEKSSDNLNIARFVNLYNVGVSVSAQFVLAKRHNVVDFGLYFICNVAES